MIFALAAALALAAAQGASTNPGTPAAVHPIYAPLPESVHNDAANRLFTQTVARYGLGPVEVVDIPRPPPPRAPELLRTGKAAAEKLRFDEAATALDAAVTEVLATGGDGLEAKDLPELFIQQAIAAQKATWRDLTGPVTEITPAKAREAYLRAAVLAPDRTLEARRYPPLAIASFKLATAEVKQRPRGDLKVRGTTSATITIDAGKPLGAPANAIGLPYGEHLIRVEDIGRKPWAALVPLTEANLEIDAPATAPVLLDDAVAAAQARRMGATFALVSTLKMGPPGGPAREGIELELRLVDAASGQARDSAVVAFLGEKGALDAAVMRLDEEARRLDLLRRGGRIPAGSGSELAIDTVPGAPVAGGVVRPRFSDDPGAWARHNWPLLTAVGVAVGTAVVLGIAVAADDRAGMTPSPSRQPTPP
jgi:hypothetical protein